MVLLLLIAASVAFGQTPAFDGRQFAQQKCGACHSGQKPAGGFNIAETGRLQSWNRAALRVYNGEMPPRAPLPIEQREAFAKWVRDRVRSEACAAGTVPGPAPVRRLSAAQYTATVRDLLNLHVDIGAGLPADGAGGEGFDNAAETLFISPIHAEKYLEAAKLALDFASKDPRGRAKFLIASPAPGVSPETAARTILGEFLPRAFRRPIENLDMEFHVKLFRDAFERSANFDDAILYALRGAMISPRFLFRIEPAKLDDYALASRLSYFLWGTMPDSLLFSLAEAGKLSDPAILKEQIARMLRNQKSTDFAQSFVGQWLRTRDLGESFKLDAGVFPEWNDTELQGDIRNQPVLFFREILANNLSILDLLDSKWTIATRKLQKVIFLTAIKPARPNNQEQPQRIELPEGSRRGGLLGMPAALAISSHPHRTSPVLRGKWLLEAILGTPPPPPPPGVPKLDDPKTGAPPATLRERLAQHRADPACASCHARIDPLGFALENYDVLGRWRTEDAGLPIDARAQLPDGTEFEGPDQLRAVLLQRKDLFVRNLTSKVLGYALGRGLTLQDSCTVDSIVAELERGNYSAQVLIDAVVNSAPFRQRAQEKQP
jgi:hypothetical protein